MRSKPLFASITAAGLLSLLAFAVNLYVPLPTLLTGARAAEDISTLKVGEHVKIHIINGGVVEGEIIEITMGAIKVKHRFGVQTINKTDIQSWERRKTNEELYKERAAKAKTADDWCDIGDWARNQIRNEDLAQQAYRKAVEVDADNERAHKALGEQKYNGEWLPLVEVMKREGKQFYEGKWRTPEEIEAYKKEQAQKLKEQKLKGKKELEREYIGRPWGEIDPIETEHYEIWCNSTEDVAEEYASMMEKLYARYNKIFGKLPRNGRKGKGTVYIHANKQQFMDWTGVSEGIGGFYRPWIGDVTAYHGSFGTTGSTYEVLAHEGTHQFEGFVLKDFRSCPMWVIEGLAVFFGDGSELKHGKIEIGEIPRDRITTLRRIIESGNLGTKGLNVLLRTGERGFPGYFYAPAWGIVYWCLWGDKTKPKANNGEGAAAFSEYLLSVVDRTGPCNYDEEAKKFISILESHTGKSIDQWEKDYEEWIMKLPLERLFHYRGRDYVSEKLGLTVEKPSGWTKVNDSELRRNEYIAFTGTGKDKRRISTFFWPNWQRGELSTTLAETLLGNLFSGIEYEKELTQQDSYGYPSVTATFTALPVVAKANTVGGGSSNGTKGKNDKGNDDSDSTERLHCRIVVYATVDKIQANVLEDAPSHFEDDSKAFDQYLKAFHIEY